MAVITKTFTGTLSDTTNTAITIKGLISETSTMSVNANLEATSHFLNALYQTLIEAGYEDTEINEDEYYVTILGAKVFSCVDKSGCVYLYIEGCYHNFLSHTGYKILHNSNNLNYGIILRGGKNNVRIKLLFANSSGLLVNTEISSIMVFSAQNIIHNNSAYIFASDFAKGPVIIRESPQLYSPTFSYSLASDRTIFTAYLTSKGNNTSEKYVVVPQLAYENSYLVPGMIQGNSTIFTNDKYYKIGTDTYYCEGGYLYRVD